MYIANTDHEQVFKEIYRILKPNSQFILWDVNIPQKIKNNLFLTFLEVKLPKKTVNTGYGVKWNDKIQDTDYFIKLGKSIGFDVESVENIKNNAFCIKFIKK